MVHTSARGQGVAQKSLNNIIKHAGATTVNIKLEYRKDKAIIIVRDNGTGFDLESASNRSGLRMLLSGHSEIDIVGEAGMGQYPNLFSIKEVV